MGGSASTFSQEELDVYEACTCLSGAEILELYEKFTDLGGVRKKDAAERKTLLSPLHILALCGDGNGDSCPRFEAGAGPSAFPSRNAEAARVLGCSRSMPRASQASPLPSGCSRPTPNSRTTS